MRVAIDGVDGAGKTTLADELVRPLRERGRPVLRASIDRFHNPRAVRYRRGPTSPEGYYRDSFDYQALTSVLLEPLGPGGDLRCRTAVFDFRTDSAMPSPVHHVQPGTILLFDGVFLLRPELYRYWDYTVFVAVDFEVSVERAVHRDLALFGTPEAVREQYRQRYVPGQQAYLRECRPGERADAVVENDDLDRPRVWFRGIC